MRWDVGWIWTLAVCLGVCRLAVAEPLAPPGPPQGATEEPIRLPPALPVGSVSAAIFELPEGGAGAPPSQQDSSEFWCFGDYRLEPYGIFWTDMATASQRMNTESAPQWVFSRGDQGESTFTIDARPSRLGFWVHGPRIPALAFAESGGRVEIDFAGSFVTENQASILVRHAYWEVQNEYFRILVGQYWDVVSPLYPGMLTYPAGWNSGNIGFRRAQFRWERYYAAAHDQRMILQASLNQDIVPDFATDPDVRREAASWPVIEGRLAYRRGQDQQRVELGVSGHIGQTGFDFLEPSPALGLPAVDDARFETWSFNVDFRAPLTNRLTTRAEFFMGANLSAFLGGIGQGVCPCRRVPVRSTGGWIDLGYDWSRRWHSHVGYGIDDPRNSDILIGRTYNQFLFGNLSYDVTSKLMTGVEVVCWTTFYQRLDENQIPPELLAPDEPGRSVNLLWTVRYGF